MSLHSTPLHCAEEPTPLRRFNLVAVTMKHHLLFFLLVALAAVATGAAAAADPQPQQVHQQHSQMRMVSRSLLQQQPTPDCPSSCSVRCSHNWKKEMCNKMCNACCHKCSCVPPGTGQDTRHLCPCYDTMINPHTGKLKCP